MGIIISTLIDSFFPGTPCRILMIGSPNAGKTTILYRLKLGKVIAVTPTPGFNVETIKYKNISFTMWDLGGPLKIRPLWEHYYQGTHGIIYVVDSSDNYSIKESKELMESVLEDERLKDAALLVFANKQDIPGALNTSELTNKLELDKYRNRQWFIQSICALTGEGLVDGLEWMANALQSKELNKV